MEIIRLNKPDLEFIRQVEEQSGQKISSCCQCGNCTAGCPMAFAFDFSVTRLMRLVQTGQKESALSSESVWMCATCETCTQRCPNNIEVAKVVEVLRHIARREKSPAIRPVKTFWDSFITSIGMNGRVHEIGLMLTYMLKTGRIFTDVDLSPKALPKGKLSILPHRTKGRSEVKAIIKRFREGAADVKAAEARLERKNSSPGAKQ